jgi:hypothetical protein
MSIEKVKRIKPEEVVLAFKETGLQPEEGAFFKPSKNCACGLGALFAYTNKGEYDEAVKTGFVEDLSCEVTTYFDDIYGQSQRLGFVHGFDNDVPTPSYIHKDYYMEGYRAGQEVRKSLGMEVIG